MPKTFQGSKQVAQMVNRPGHNQESAVGFLVGLSSRNPNLGSRRRPLKRAVPRQSGLVL